MRWMGCLVLLTVSACVASQGHTAADAVVNTAVAAGAAGLRRMDGECYTPCQPGTFCNRSTGMCDPRPCHDRCGPREVCDTSGGTERCVPDTDLAIQRREGAPVASPTAAKPVASPSTPAANTAEPAASVPGADAATPKSDAQKPDAPAPSKPAPAPPRDVPAAVPNLHPNQP